MSFPPAKFSHLRPTALERLRALFARDALRPAAGVIAGVHLLLAGAYATSGDLAGIPLSVLAAVTGTAAVLAWQLMGERKIPARAAHAVAAPLVGSSLLNVLLALAFRPGPAATAVAALLVVAGGELFYAPTWYAGTMIAMNLLLATAAAILLPSGQLAGFFAVQGLAAMLSFGLFRIRSLHVRRLASLQAAGGRSRNRRTKDGAAGLSVDDADQLETARLARELGELEAAKRRAEGAARAKSELLAFLSHEIRTPMTAVLGYTALLAERAVHDEEMRAWLDIVQRNGSHLLQVVNQVLDLSRIEAGTLRVVREPCSPIALVREVQALLLLQAREKGLTRNTVFHWPLPEFISTDPTRLRQVLINLVANALTFTNLGSVEIITRFLSAPANNDNGRPSPGGWIEFQVVDTGVGLSREQLATVFQPFVRLDHSASDPGAGAGLGLAISKELATLLGGRLDVESQVGRGSCFRLTIATGPLEGVRFLSGPDEPAVPSCPAVEAPARPAKPTLPKGRRVLVAEDAAGNQRLLTFLLSGAGADVSVAENGEAACASALAAWREGRPFDVVLMDTQMPVLDGYEATRALRAAGYPLPVIALTAHALRGDRERCLAAGCDDYIAKPVDRQTLVEVVRKQLKCTARIRDWGCAQSPKAGQEVVGQEVGVKSTPVDELP